MKVSYVKLDIPTQTRIAVRLELRRKLYEAALAGKIRDTDRVLIVGDKPGPSAPTDSRYHHTPFYSTKHCSGWLNACLEVEAIPEEKLIWLNAADRLGNEFDLALVNRLNPDTIIALGGNAQKWLRKGCISHVEVVHPQYHKRFHNAERYVLLDILQALKN